MSSKFILKNAQEQEFSINHLDNAGAISIDSDNIITKSVVSVTDNAIARYDGTTGKLQNSGVVIDDDNNVGIGTNAISAGGLTVNGNTPNYSQIHLTSGTTLASSRQAYFRALDGGSVGSFDGQAFSGLQIGTLRPDGNASTSIAFYTALGATLTRQVLLDPSGNLLLTSGTGGIGYGVGAGGTVTQLTSKSTAVTLNKPSGQITMNNAALAAGATVSFTVNNSLVTVSDQVVPKVAQASLLYSIVTSNIGNGSFVLYLKNESAASRSEAINVTFSIIKGVVA